MNQNPISSNLFSIALRTLLLILFDLFIPLQRPCSLTNFSIPFSPLHLDISNAISSNSLSFCGQDRIRTYYILYNTESLNS